MMDQHLTYVSMTRHRHRADIYAAREDFEMNAEWWRKSRVDYGLGIAGGLVETGLAKFGHQKERSEQSPYADVKTNDGTVHRLWGVSLPQALSAGGVSEGDTVLLKKDGVEIVKVKIPVIDKETGQKSLGTRGRAKRLDRKTARNRSIKIGTDRARKPPPGTVRAIG